MKNQRTQRLFNWTGSKARVASKLVPLFPEGEKYIEPFVGSGAVILNKEKRHNTEILCDMDRDLAVLHGVLADAELGNQLLAELKQVKVCLDTFQNAKINLQYNDRLSYVLRAKYKYISTALSFNGQGKFYSTAKTQESFQRHIDRIPDIIKRYHGVQVKYGHGIELMKQYCADEDTFIFADPPYLPELRGLKNIYACEMTREEHVYMLSVIKNARCKIMLCGYAEEDGSGLYDRVLLTCGWKRYKLAELVQSCQVTGKRGVGTEYIWVNYDLPEKECISMGERELRHCA